MKKEISTGLCPPEDWKEDFETFLEDRHKNVEVVDVVEKENDVDKLLIEGDIRDIEHLYYDAGFFVEMLEDIRDDLDEEFED